MHGMGTTLLSAFRHVPGSIDYIQLYIASALLPGRSAPVDNEGGPCERWRPSYRLGYRNGIVYNSGHESANKGRR